MYRPLIAITMGDAAGVGPEIIMKSLAHAALYETCRPLVVGDARRLREAGRIAGVDLDVRCVAGPGEGAYAFGSVDCLDLGLIPDGLPFGKLSALAGDAAYRYIEKAVELAAGRAGRRDLHRAAEQGGAARGRTPVSRATPRCSRT